MKYRYGLAVAVVAVIALCMGLPLGLHAQGEVRKELIVLLATDQKAVLTPEDLVEWVGSNQELPADLGVGSPTKAEFIIPARDRRSKGESDPDGPEALLERYVVLSYPSPVDLEAIRQALELNPNVLWVGENLEFHVSAAPNDPLFPATDVFGNPRTPDQYQWGSHALKLPAAWDYNKGRAYVGVIDLGIDTTHPDLRPFHMNGSTLVYDGGNFRPQFSFDYGYPTESPNSVDEGQPQIEMQNGILAPRTVSIAGHGTHVAGIVAATPNNQTGVAGACWHCSLIISKVSRLAFRSSQWVNAATTQANVVAGMRGAIERGAQILNLSLGYRPDISPVAPNCASDPLNPFCTVLDLAQRRDVAIAAATGNDFNPVVDFPASDSRVIAVGGITPAGSFWNDCSAPGPECGGSNYDPDQVVAPAKQILSTFYRGLFYQGAGQPCAGFDDFGLCTGTSMSSPYIAGSLGVLRSVDPLLGKASLKSLLTGNVDNPAGWNPAHGHGKPNVGAAVKAALGKVGGVVIPNRLTPLFSLYSPVVEDFFYTTVPQMAASAVLDSGGYSSFGPLVPGYSLYPGTECQVGPCAFADPTASAYVFTGDRAPFAGALLVPLYRLSFKGSNPNGNTSHRDTNYTTDESGIVLFKGIGYELDGIEGYIYKKCTPEPSCIPPSAVKLMRRYHPQRDDFAIFPESELTTMQSLGYTSTGGVSDVLGYVYPNADTDGDAVIDGFENLVGTKANLADSDCDGANDGQELLGFGVSGRGDPNQGPCGAVFADVPPGHWAKSFIEAIYIQGVTTGCATNPLQYCPGTLLDRASIAPFLLRAKLGSSFVPPAPNCASPLFADVPCTHWAAPWIEELARQGITGGCAVGSYCPADPVDRSQIAVFLLRTLNGITYTPPPVNCGSPRFTDVPCTHWAAPWIEELANQGITGGCTTTAYCPASVVDRAQMAVFLVRTFNFPLP